VLKALAAVPAATFDAIGRGRVYANGQFTITRLHGGLPGRPTLTASIAEWCPHCIAGSWAIALALERFGTLAGLRTISSGTYFARHGGRPAYSNTRGLSFVDAHYASAYLRFDPIIVATSSGRPFRRATRAERRRLASFHGNASFPALDLGGAYGALGLGFSPGILRGLRPTTIAGELADPHSALAPYIVGEANVLTAALCVATGRRPAALCGSPGVSAAAARL
jgi:hypothetical protein